jgi:cell division protein DivIC
MSRIQKLVRPFRNKYLLVGTLFVLYAVFLDDVDVFMMVGKHRKLSQLKEEKGEMETKLQEIADMQSILKHQASLERFAREERLFHKPNEDIYVISYE